MLLDSTWNRRPECRLGSDDLEQALAECDAAVRIGDKALFEKLSADYTAHDLGQVWTERTGLPFVFAVWAARPGVVDREIYTLLHESRRRGSRHIEQIVEEYTWRGERYPEIALDYLTRRIRFRLGSAELQAMRRFFAAAEVLGLIDRAPEIRLALHRRTACHEAAAR